MTSDNPRNEIRCFCTRHPLLAIFGIDKGKPFVHVKVFKNRRIYGEILVTKGDIQLRCRECLRWYTIEIGGTAPKLTETPEPEMVADEAPSGMFDPTTT